MASILAAKRPHSNRDKDAKNERQIAARKGKEGSAKKKKGKFETIFGRFFFPPGNLTWISKRDGFGKVISFKIWQFWVSILYYISRFFLYLFSMKVGSAFMIIILSQQAFFQSQLVCKKESFTYAPGNKHIPPGE